ncbi:MAG: uracil-DNA glycosylase [Gemmatales bacterium]|nr:uracil-DNA glycosylase [Gemmatales bacterium]MCS7160113.1 uracil-DNA glycosylase [Gemmatales bacterium]MDW8175313.1 uracil-DNA glycosylase [Gemmatales bacterium]MDW8221633.1 uracil-DNA glycosylase [Gemmatales bacterium]
MSDAEVTGEERISQAVGLYLEALRYAGLEWLPRCRPDSSRSEGRVAGQASAAAPGSEGSGATSSEQEAPPAAQSAPSPQRQMTAKKSSGTVSRTLAVPGTLDSLFEQPLASSAQSPQEKARALEELNRSQVVGCTKCAELVRNRTQTVFGVGAPDAELVLVGEAPGQEEDAQGEPFVGAAGQLLNRILEGCGFRRAEVYICNVLKCRPPNNRTPLPNEIANCRGYLEQQLAIIAPKYILCLGAIAAQTLLQTNQSISKLRGQVHRYRGAALICTYHPAYLLRNPQAKRDVWEDMKLLLRTMGRPIPRR